MKSNIVDALASKLQNLMYDELECNSKPTNTALSIPVVIADVAIETLKIPLRVVESVALAVLNFLGAAFYKNYSLKDTLWNVERALTDTVTFPIAVALAPLKLLYQFFEILRNIAHSNQNFQSIHAYHYWNPLTDLQDLG